MTQHEKIHSTLKIVEQDRQGFFNGPWPLPLHDRLFDMLDKHEDPLDGLAFRRDFMAEVERAEAASFAD